jgi:hypothetical protein
MNNTLSGSNQETSVKIEYFSIITTKPDDFINELESLCEKFCAKGDFFFKFNFEG